MKSQRDLRKFPFPAASAQRSRPPPTPGKSPFSAAFRPKISAAASVKSPPFGSLPPRRTSTISAASAARAAASVKPPLFPQLDDQRSLRSEQPRLREVFVLCTEEEKRGGTSLPGILLSLLIFSRCGTELQKNSVVRPIARTRTSQSRGGGKAGVQRRGPIGPDLCNLYDLHNKLPTPLVGCARSVNLPPQPSRRRPTSSRPRTWSCASRGHRGAGRLRGRPAGADEGGGRRGAYAAASRHVKLKDAGLRLAARGFAEELSHHRVGERRTTKRTYSYAFASGPALVRPKISAAASVKSPPFGSLPPRRTSTISAASAARAAASVKPPLFPQLDDQRSLRSEQPRLREVFVLCTEEEKRGGTSLPGILLSLLIFSRCGTELQKNSVVRPIARTRTSQSRGGGKAGVQRRGPIGPDLCNLYDLHNKLPTPLVGCARSVNLPPQPSRRRPTSSRPRTWSCASRGHRGAGRLRGRPAGADEGGGRRGAYAAASRHVKLKDAGLRLAARGFAEELSHHRVGERRTTKRTYSYAFASGPALVRLLPCAP